MSMHLHRAFRDSIGDLNIKQVYQSLQARSYKRRAFRGAMTQAYTTCARHDYPKWASYLLDKEFQMPGEGRLRECYLQGKACMGPLEMARFWANQIEWISEDAKQRHIAELVPVAERFLRLLALELSDRDLHR